MLNLWENLYVYGFIFLGYIDFKIGIMIEYV